MAALSAAIPLMLSFASCGSRSSSSGSVTEQTYAVTTSGEAETTEASSAEPATEKAEPAAESTTEEASTEAGTIRFSDLISDREPTPALWKTSDPSTGNTLYMMGTVHMADPKLLTFPEYILDVYESCEGIAVEYDTEQLMADASAMQSFVADMMYLDGTTIADHISAETYEKARTFLSDNGMYSSYYDMLMPGFWVDLVGVSSLLKIEGITSSGVETYFTEKCAEDGKAVVSIEELEAQKNALIGYSDALADYELSCAVDEAEDTAAMAESFAALYDCWASGDIDALAEYSVEEVPAELEADYADYQELILYSRNRKMAEKAAEYLAEGKNYFFMAGSLHFAGEEGVDDLLAGMGYTVERIH